MKTVNLAKALMKNKNCLGFIWRFSNGRYGYQNDNDLGLAANIDEVDCKQSYVKKVYIAGRHYVYQVKGGFMDDGSGTGYKTALALIKECHEFSLPLTKHEKMLVNRYWNQF